MIYPTIVVLVTAFASAIVFTLIVRAVARRTNFVDRPERERKLHCRVTPLGGGLAVFAATIVAVAAVLLVSEVAREVVAEHGRDLVVLLVAAVIVCLVGLADDRNALRGRQKLAGQIVGVGVLVYFGLCIRHLQILDWRLDLGPLAVPFTVFWLLGAINALNLLDGADGFATTLGIIICGTIAGMAHWAGHPMEAMVATALAGALLGFLIFNFPPASIFLGDAGSTVIGLAVGALAIRSSLKGPATVALAAPLAVLTIPILDSTAAIVRRWLTGRSMYTADRGHLHHSLLRQGMSPRLMLLGVAVMCAVTAAGALTSIFIRNEMAALLSAGTVVAILVLSKVFGFSELMLVANRALAFGTSLVSSVSNNDQMVRQESVRLQGSKNWDELWSTLTDFAETHDLNKVRLDLNLAWLHEGYHATWRRCSRWHLDEAWTTSLPLVANNRTIGRLEIIGPMNESMDMLLNAVAELLDSVKPCILGLAEELPKDSLEETEASPDDWTGRIPHTQVPATDAKLPAKTGSVTS